MEGERSCYCYEIAYEKANVYFGLPIGILHVD